MHESLLQLLTLALGLRRVCSGDVKHNFVLARCDVTDRATAPRPPKREPPATEAAADAAVDGTDGVGAFAVGVGWLR